MNRFSRILKKSLALILALLLISSLGLTTFAVSGDILPFSGTDITSSFSDNAFLNVVRNQISKPSGPIYDDDVANVKSLVLYDLGISNLSGIEYFTELVTLVCSYNRLTVLDLSNNTNLTNLLCTGNRLTKLDMSKNTKLRLLYCDSNVLGELNVSNCADLVDLDCGINQLTELDLTTNRNLDRLFCNNNLLTGLNLSQNTVLRMLTCNGNKFSALNLSNMTQLTFLDCHDDQLTELNIVGAASLSVLYCNDNQLESINLAGAPNLALLHCHNNRIKELNLAGAANLVFLYCQNNQLTELNLTGCTALRSLLCRNNYILSESAIAGLGAIQSQLEMAFYDQYPRAQFMVQPPANTNVREGNITESLSATVATTQGATVSYQWYQSATPADSGGTPVSGAVSAVFPIPQSLTIGTYYYYCVVTVTNGLGTANETSNVATVAVTTTGQQLVSVTGKVRSYNPRNVTNLKLLQGGTVIYETTIQAEDGLDQLEQSFAFTNVLPGTYTLLITKTAHTSFTVQNVVVGNTGLDFTKDIRETLQCMTLLCGDINGDGMINNADLASLWMSANYNRSTALAAEPLCDLNGDGMINSADVAILWLAENYNRGAVIIQYQMANM